MFLCETGWPWLVLVIHCLLGKLQGNHGSATTGVQRRLLPLAPKWSQLFVRKETAELANWWLVVTQTGQWMSVVLNIVFHIVWDGWLTNAPKGLKPPPSVGLVITQIISQDIAASFQPNNMVSLNLGGFTPGIYGNHAAWAFVDGKGAILSWTSIGGSPPNTLYACVVGPLSNVHIMYTYRSLPQNGWWENLQEHVLRQVFLIKLACEFCPILD